MKAVVDASVLIRSVVPGPDTDACRKWLTEVQIIMAPRLIWYEVTSVLRRLEYLGAMDANSVDASLKVLMRLPITISGSKSIYHSMLQLARQLNVSRTYDMAYVALALAISCPLITLDRHLINSASSNGYAVHHPADLIEKPN